MCALCRANPEREPAAAILPEKISRLAACAKTSPDAGEFDAVGPASQNFFVPAAGWMEDFRHAPVVSDKADGDFRKDVRQSRHVGGMGRSWIRTVVLCGALAVGGIAALPVAAAQQGSTVYDIQIRDSSLADALLELARQTKVQLLFPYDMADKIRVAPLSGRYTFDEALNTLLRNTGLSGGLVRDGVVRISPITDRGEDPVSPKAKATLLSGASAFIVGAFSAPSYAQDAQDPAVRDVVVVTAQRREQDLQEVPLSVSTFSGADLEDIGAADLTEVGKFSPNVTLEVSRGTNSTLSAFIRGVGQQDPVGGFEAGVGIYLDDVYLNRPQGAVLDVFDVERIEVLRGPQGTLYGRNTIGGAVKYVTRGLASDPTMKLTVNAGSYSKLEGILSASTPLSDTFRIGGAVAKLTRGGYGDNLVQSGVENYNKDVSAARFQAEWDISDDIDVRFSADWLLDKSDPKQGHRLITSLQSGLPPLNDVYDTRAGLVNPHQRSEAYGGSLVATWNLNDNWAVKNILAYREDESSTPIDFDSLPALDVDVPAIYENDQFSEELQFLFTSDNLNGLIGVYYLDANALTAFDVVLATTGALIGVPGLNAQTFGDVNTKTWSVFADFTYDISPDLHLSLGGRYTDDQREAQVLRRTFMGGYSPLFGGTAVPIATTSNFNGNDTFTDFSPRVSLAWDAAPDHNVYGTYAKGFKGGGFDPRGQTSAAPDTDLSGIRDPDEIFDFMQFEPETVDSYELGWKAVWERGRFTTNLAAFWMDYKDVQVPSSIGVDTNNDGINDTFTGATTNAAAATLKGIEFDGTAVLGENWVTAGDELSTVVSVGYIDAKYDDFIGPTGVDVANQRVFQNTPDLTASWRVNYATPFTLLTTPGHLTFVNSLSYRSDSSQFEVAMPLLDQSAYTLWDMSLIFRSDENWTIGLHGKNLGDERYKVAGYNFVTQTGPNTFVPTLGREGTLTAFYGDPRTWWVSIGHEF
jgi:iron complex outermembrane receptor protein